MRTKYGFGTFLTQSFPWGMYRHAAGLCSDGKVRSACRIAPTPDTFFSIPGSVKVGGKTVSGYFSHEDIQGVTTVLFIQYRYGKNGAMLPDLLPSQFPLPKGHRVPIA